MVSDFVNVTVFLPYSDDFFQLFYCLDLKITSIMERYSIRETKLEYRQRIDRGWITTIINGDQTLIVIMGRPKELGNYTGIITTIDGIELQYGLYSERLEKGRNGSKKLFQEVQKAGKIIYHQNRTIIPSESL